MSYFDKRFGFASVSQLIVVGILSSNSTLDKNASIGIVDLLYFLYIFLYGSSDRHIQKVLGN